MHGAKYSPSSAQIAFAHHNNGPQATTDLNGTPTDPDRLRSYSQQQRLQFIPKQAVAPSQKFSFEAFTNTPRSLYLKAVEQNVRTRAPETLQAVTARAPPLGSIVSPRPAPPSTALKTIKRAFYCPIGSNS